MTREAERRRAYAIGYRLAHARGQRELAELRQLLDEQRRALREWRDAVTERRRLETEMMDFYRNVFSQVRDGVLLH